MSTSVVFKERARVHHRRDQSFKDMMANMSTLVKVTKKPKPKVKLDTNEGPGYMLPARGDHKNARVKTIKSFNNLRINEKIALKPNTSFFIATSTKVIRAKNKFLQMLTPARTNKNNRPSFQSYSISRSVNETYFGERRSIKKSKFVNETVRLSYTILYEYKLLLYKLELEIEDERYPHKYKGIKHMQKKLLVSTFKDMIDHLLKIIQKHEDRHKRFKKDPGYEKQKVPEYLIPLEELDIPTPRSASLEYYEHGKIINMFQDYLDKIDVAVQTCTSPRTRQAKASLQDRIDQISQDYYESSLFIKTFDYKANKQISNKEELKKLIKSPFERKMTELFYKIDRKKYHTQTENRDLFEKIDSKGNAEATKNIEENNQDNNVSPYASGHGTYLASDAYLDIQSSRSIDGDRSKKRLMTNMKLITPDSKSLEDANIAKKHVGDVVRMSSIGSLPDEQFYQNIPKKGFMKIYKFKLKNKNMAADKRCKLNDMFFDPYVVESVKDTIFTRPIKKCFADLNNPPVEKYFVPKIIRTTSYFSIEKEAGIDKKKFFIAPQKVGQPSLSVDDMNMNEGILSANNKEALEQKSMLLDKVKDANKHFLRLFDNRLNHSQYGRDQFSLGEFFSKHLEKDDEMKPSGMHRNHLDPAPLGYWKPIQRRPTGLHYRKSIDRVSLLKPTKHKYGLDQSNQSDGCLPAETISKPSTNISAKPHPKHKQHLDHQRVSLDKHLGQMRKEFDDLHRASTQLVNPDERSLHTFLKFEDKQKHRYIDIQSSDN